MRLQFLVNASRAAVTACILALAPSAFGQNGAIRINMSTVEAAAAQASTQQAPGTPQRLSMDDAVHSALEQNLGIRIQRIDPQIQDVGVLQSRSFWSPQLSTGFSHQAQTQQAQDAFSGGDITNISGNAGVTQVLPWGGNYSASWNNARGTTNNTFTSFPVNLRSTLNAQYTQPLARNYKIDQIRQNVQNSKKARDLSDVQLRGVITQTTRQVRNAYWDLVYAINNYKAQQQSLALSQQFLKDNQKRVEIGTLAPIDIVQAQAEVASNDQGVIVADANIKAAQDALRTLILDPGTPGFWDVVFDPTDAPAFEDQAIDIDGAVRHAMDTRTDILSAKNSLAQSDINIKYYRNQTLPDVNAQVSYVATATGGQQLGDVDFANLAAARAIKSDIGFGSVLGSVLRSAYPTWTVGVQVGYPLGTNTAQANLARSRLQYEQAQAQMKSIEMNVIAQVRSAARNVVTFQKSVQSARASRELQEKKLEAEEKKLAAGMSQSFFVFQAQRDLAVSRVQEIQAIASYNKALVDFQAVQEVPLGGGGGGITTAGTGAVQTGGSAIVRQ